MNEEKQAMMLARQFLTNAAQWHSGFDLVRLARRRSGSERTRTSLRPGSTRIPKRTDSGLRTKAGIPRGQNSAAAFQRFRFEQRLLVGTDDDYVLVFAKDGERRLAVWTTSPGKNS
jgi:hypothetical protein